METEYWPQRLFRNTFTYNGRSVKVRGWSVKIQISGRRKTFSLSSSDRMQAAAEACYLYQTINTQGWEAIGQRRAGGAFQPHFDKVGAATADGVGSDPEHWKSRLIHRPYPQPTDSPAGRALSVRIEHAGTGCYFPLGTPDEAAAAAMAVRIHQTIIQQGWAVANQKFSRDLTLALRWLDDPLAWTYTTIHTWKSGDPSPPLANQNPKSARRSVAIIEPDAGIRLALAACVNSQDGFKCRTVHPGATEALREITRQPVDIILANYSLPNKPGSVCLQELQRVKPGLVGLLYSVFEDSDLLFKSTPGGSAGYMLKRTPAFRIFDPIAETTTALTRELIATRIREYFQRLVEAMPAGPSVLELAKLTPREHETLALLAKGYLAKEIADALGISIWTVHGHAKSIFEKLNVHTRTEAVVKFLQK